MSFVHKTGCCATALVAFFLVGMFYRTAHAAPSNATAPVLVELFTSEGCSSCPPADALLQQLDRAQPIPGTQLIVLSEHVDYWNSLGWKDPYSSAFFSDRQSAYARHFGLASAYTPEMVVDGSSECLGSDPALAQRAIEKARGSAKVPVRISAVGWEAGELHAHVEAGPLPDGSAVRKAGVYVAAALDHAESQVARGENEGRKLTHVAVALNLIQVGSLERGKTFSQDVRLKPAARGDLSKLRLLAFVQESAPGPVLGAALEQVTK